MLKISCNDFNIFTHLVEGQSMYVDKRQSIYDCWLLLIKSLTELISPLIKLNINEICGRTATWHFLFCPTCTLYTSSLVPYSCSPFSLLYLSFAIGIVCIFLSCFLFILSFCPSFSLSFSHRSRHVNLSFLSQACLVSSFPSTLLSFSHSSSSCLFSLPFSFFTPRYFSISPSLSLSLSHPLSPTAKPVGEVQSLTRRETSNNHVSWSSIFKLSM